MSEYYPTWGKKRSFHGDIYQLKWLMLFLKRAVDREYSFRLATEMESAAGFDDIVFRYKQDGTIVHRFVQVKHKQDGTEKISVGKLLTKDKNGEFRLAKYFVSYLKIKNNQDFADSNLKDFIVCTNINFDLDQNTVKKLKVKTSGPNKGIEILVDAIDTSDVFFKDSGTRYRFSCTHNNMISVMQPAFKKAVEEAVKELKKEIEELRGKSDQNSKRKLERNQTWQREFKRMTNEGRLEDTIKEFFDKLVFAVDQPNESQLEKLMKDEISNELARKFKYFGDNEFAYYAFFMMVLGWMKDREGRFLSPKEGREFFQKVELWASTVSEIRQGVERIEEKVDEIGEVLNNQQTRKEPIWLNMRYPVKTFTGRESKLQEIYDKLHESTGNPMAVSRIVVISGLGGIGKSELARKYAYEYRKDYDGNVIWINAETQKDLEESFKRLARELSKRLSEDSKISTTGEGIESTIENVYRYFEDVKGLFIFDNAEGYRNISKFLPSSLNYKPYVLITSRDTKWEIGQKVAMEVIKLDVFKKSEALEFVEKFLDIDSVSQDEEIEELIEELKCFPLALKQAVAYIHNKNKESKLRDYGRFEISDYLKKYQQHPEKLLKEGVYENEDCYTKTIFTTWDVTIEAIKRKECGIEALSILGIMAYLALDDIRIKEIFSKSTEDDKKKLWNAVKLLDRYSMINLKKRIVNIHRLVQKVIRLKLQEKGQEEETLRKALELINSNNAVKEDVSYIVSVWEHASKHGKLIDEFYFNSIYVRKVMFSKKNKESNPLHLLAENGSCKAIMAILTHVEKHHLDKLEEVINIKNNRDRTLLHIAAYKGKLDVVEYLISKGACFNVKDKLNGTPLHSAAEGGNYEVVKAVLAHIERKHSGGLSKVVNAKTNNGATPLHLAAYNGKLNIAELLINKGANVDARNGYNETPLSRAVIGGNLKVVEYFVGKDTYSNVRTETGDTLLHLAVKSGRLEVVKCFVEKGAEVNAKGKNNETPLHLAIHVATFSEDLSIVKYLINKGADVDAKNGNNETPLHIAIKNGNLKIMKYLIGKDANVNAKDRDGNTPLHHTVLMEEVDTAKVLIGEGANVSAKNRDGNTPLHLAAMNGELDIAKILLEHNTNVDARNHQIMTALDCATNNNHQKLVKLLLAHGAVSYCY